MQIRIEPEHPWRPPFDLDRIGHPVRVVVEIGGECQTLAEFSLVCYREARETARSVLPWTGQPPHVCQLTLAGRPTELAVEAKFSDGATVELARQTFEWPSLEADAVATPDRTINPVDLGTILPPSDWLLLEGSQKGSIDLAAISHDADVPDAHVAAWFESAPASKTVSGMALTKGRRAQLRMPLPPTPTTLEHDVLHVRIASADGVDLWRKTIQTMVVHQLPRWPEFGAIQAKLRYDAPISVRRPDGSFTSMSYANAWDPQLQDVVVALPNGARFVFWRGSSYIPFWAGQHNTGLCYEWAECEPPADACDAVEPLMDKDLRYGRVHVVESTPARVHVRWTYQSCDLNYKTWGDSAVEDYYFYPDGFGNRVLTLQSDPKANYELNELIVLTSQSTYPFRVLPTNLVDILFIDGQKRELTFPFYASDQKEKMQPRDLPAVYRIRMHKNESMAAVYFNPLEKNLPMSPYGHFADRGQVVTPVYWGSHWPLARGNSTGGAIDDRISFTPCHNSIMTWGYSRRPEPVRTARSQMPDSLGRTKPMIRQTWAWLIGMSDADDARLLQWARSVSAPPALSPHGARLDAESSVPERRALRLIVEDTTVTIKLAPRDVCVNPVLELANAPKNLARVQLGERPLTAREYAWDGQTLWISATLLEATTLTLEFSDS